MPTSLTSTPAGRPPIWLGLLILYAVWGSTYLGIAIAVDTIPPFLMASCRFAVAGLVLLAWCIARDRRSFVLPRLREVRDSAIVGILLLGGGMGMVAFGEQTVPSGITALLVAMMPVWVAVLGRILLGQRLPRLAGVGIVVGFAGVATLIGPSAFGVPGAFALIGIAALTVSPISWALGSLFASHSATPPRRPFLATGIQMVAGAIALAVMAVGTGELTEFHLGAISGASVAALAYLTIIGSLRPSLPMAGCSAWHHCRSVGRMVRQPCRGGDPRSHHP